MRAELLTPHEAIYTLEHRFCLKDAKKIYKEWRKKYMKATSQR